jgi:uncharacterized protein YndB with AHSA1/START domain
MLKEAISMEMKPRVTGQTKSVGFQIGVRRTLPLSQEQAWRFITSGEGIELWLEKGSNLQLRPGYRYETKTGAAGEVRIVKPLQQLRLTWHKAEWQKASTVQVRIIANGSDKTTISFHQEQLSDAAVREEMKQHWEDVLKTIAERL